LDIFLVTGYNLLEQNLLAAECIGTKHIGAKLIRTNGSATERIGYKTNLQQIESNSKRIGYKPFQRQNLSPD
jgi:hypothetical protein